MKLAKIEKLAKEILDARAKFPESSLVVLYDSFTMSPELLKGHQALDRAVVKLYGFCKDMMKADVVVMFMERYRDMVGGME